MSDSSPADYTETLYTFFGEAYKHRNDRWTTESATEAALDMLCASNAVRRGATVLDIGCGRGQHARRLAQYGLNVTGVDLIASSDWQARSNSEVGSLRFEVGNFLEWQCSETYDVVLDSGCFHHQAPCFYHEYLGKVRALLKPEGIYFMILFGRNEETPEEAFVSNRRYSAYFDESEIGRLMEAEHFSVVKTARLPRKWKDQSYLVVWAASK